MAAEDLLTNKNRAGIGHVTKTYFCNLQCVSSPPNTMSRIPINGVSLDVIYHKDFIGMLGSIIHGFSSISSPLLCRGRIWDMSLLLTRYYRREACRDRNRGNSDFGSRVSPDILCAGC